MAAIPIIMAEFRVAKIITKRSQRLRTPTQTPSNSSPKIMPAFRSRHAELNDVVLRNSVLQDSVLPKGTNFEKSFAQVETLVLPLSAVLLMSGGLKPKKKQAGPLAIRLNAVQKQVVKEKAEQAVISKI